MNKFYKTFFLFFLAAFFIQAQDSTMVVVGPGVKYYKVFKPAVPWNITILEIDVSNPDIKLQTELARDHLGTGLEKTTSMAARNSSPNKIILGAVNGDYFGISDPTNPYTFLSNSMIEDHEFTFGRSHIRSSFGFTEDNKPVLDILNFAGTVTASNNNSRAIDLVNGIRGTDKLILYNEFFQPTTGTNASGIEIRLQKVDDPEIGGSYRFIAVEKISGVGDMTINGDYILSGHGTANTFLNNNVSVGDTVSLAITTAPFQGNLLSLMGGGPRLITNGTRPSSFVGVEGFGESHVNTRHPRTAVGFNQDSTKVYFVVVDGRQPALSVGMSCAELADYMISIGCYHGVNLDGGGSSTMVVRESIKNSPSDGSERSVGNALLAVLEAPSIGYMQSFNLLPRQILIDSTQTRKININAIDQWGYPIVVGHSDFTWEVVGIGGSVNSAGFFVPSGTGSGKIIASYNALKDTIDVSVVEEIIPVWSYSAAGNNMPSWFSPTASTERGMAVGVTAGEPRLLVVSRSAGTRLMVLNASNGDQLSNYNISGTVGGTFVLNDVEASDDGYIFAANLTTDAQASPFKVYRWENEISAPQVAISFTGGEGGIRLGDKFTVAGSYSDGTAQVYAMQSISNKIYKWTMSNGVFNQTPQVITLNGISSAGYTPAVYPKGLDSAANIFVNGTTIRPREYTQAGTLVAEAPANAVASTSSAMRYFKSGEQEYLIVFQHGLGNENAKVLEISGGLAAPVIIETSPSLGSNANTVATAGDIAYRNYQQGVYIYYVMSTNNGFGAYQLVNENEIPVELASFTASLSGNKVLLNWITATEVNNQGFEIERRSRDNSWSRIAFVPGNGTTSEPVEYFYSDDLSKINGRSYSYRLKQVDYDGTFTYSNTVEVVTGPISYKLEQNYPNPFNPITNLRFTISDLRFVELKVYDILGKEIATLVSEVKEPGEYEVEWNASHLASGVYYYRLTAGSFSDTKKLVLMK